MNTYHHGNLKQALLEAGVEIVAKDGLQALTLRKVARNAGVSHNAPYTHFADKQALIAGIATDGFSKLLDALKTASDHYPDDPARRLVEMAWAYVQFAIDNPAHFKVTFSGIVEDETRYPEYVEVSQQSLNLVVQVVKDCHQQGLLNTDNISLMAVSVWASVHGFISLLQGNLVPSHLLTQFGMRQMLITHIVTTIPFTRNLDFSNT